MDLGVPELLIILVIALLVFGSNRLPKLARSLGEASREFKAGTTEGSKDDVITSASAAPVTASPHAAPSCSEPARG